MGITYPGVRITYPGRADLSELWDGSASAGLLAIVLVVCGGGLPRGKKTKCPNTFMGKLITGNIFETKYGDRNNATIRTFEKHLENIEKLIYNRNMEGLYKFQKQIWNNLEKRNV